MFGLSSAVAITEGGFYITDPVDMLLLKHEDSKSSTSARRSASAAPNVEILVKVKYTCLDGVLIPGSNFKCGDFKLSLSPVADIAV
jgi:hypothetical protein